MKNKEFCKYKLTFHWAANNFTNAGKTLNAMSGVESGGWK